MKNITFRNLQFLTLSAMLAGCVPLHAADPAKVPWNDFCRVTQERQLEITTAAGDTVSGYCISIDAKEVGINSGGKIVKIGRTALSRIRIERFKGGQLRSLGHDLRSGLKTEVGWLLSPSAIGGIVSIPPTLVWGAITAPFCALGDLNHHLFGKEEIKLI